MSQKTTYTCDGCGQSTLDSDSITNVISQGGCLDFEYDLCRSCAEVIVNNIRFRLKKWQYKG